MPILVALLTSKEEILQSCLAISSKQLISALGHVFTESDFGDIRATILEKLNSVPLVSAACRESAAHTLTAVAMISDNQISTIISSLTGKFQNLIEYSKIGCLRFSRSQKR